MYGYLPSRRTSLPCDWYQIILLGDNRGTCMWTTCPQSLPGNETADSQTCDLYDHSFYLSDPISFDWGNCDWSQPRQTGSLHSTQPSLPWLRPITAHSVWMKWGQLGWDEIVIWTVLKGWYVMVMVSVDPVDDVVAMTTASWSRMSCRQLLESVTCYDVMPRKTCVVVVDSELPVCFHSWFHSCLLVLCHWSCPVWTLGAK